MKKIFGLMLATIMICGASVFTSCNTDAIDNPAQPNLHVSQLIEGRWITAEMDGLPVPTNQKVVINFISPTEAYMSASFNDHLEKTDGWIDLIETNVEIKGNTITMTNVIDQNSKVESVFEVTSINDKEFTAIQTLTTIVNGVLVDAYQLPVRFAKVKVDYSADIIGMWEGHVTSEMGSEFDDGETHRWEFLLDGSFNFFRKKDGHWHISDDAYAEYFVAGNLLCTRWKNAGEGQEEHREWWEIESIKDGVMKWKALRQREDGTTYTATFEMKKIDVPTQAEVEQNIIGRWMTTTMDFQNIPTNNKIVFEFESLTKAYLNASLNSKPEIATFWNDKTEFAVMIEDNHIVLVGQKDEHTAMLDDFIVSYITADVMQCVITHSEINGEGEVVVKAPAVFCTFKKVDKDFSQTILGTWEGQATSDEGTYGDGKQHRWEYKADGTFVYYVKDGDDWVPSTNTLNEYFVAGNLLCTRWIDNDIEYREWWEIESIENDVMKWKALRQKEDGTTFTSTFEMKKVTE